MKKNKPQGKLDLKQQELQSKVLGLFREIVGGVNLSEIKLPENLEEGQDRIDFSQYCHTVYNNPFFKQILEALYYKHIMNAAVSAPNYDEVTFSRASANGIMLVGEMFQKWANIYDQDYSVDKPEFDPKKSFEPTKV